MFIENNKSLKKLNTFGIEAKARFFANINKAEDLLDLMQTSQYQDSKRFILGGGSNILFSSDFDGLIISSNIKGINLKAIDSEKALVEVGSGEIWDDFVRLSIKNKYYGFENLALIPGKVGAAPVQNIGAYACEQKDYFSHLSGIKLSTGEKLELDFDECQFAYRDSIFKHELKDDFFVSSVVYNLDKKWTPNLKYKELDIELKKFGFDFINQDAEYVYNTVCRVRKTKLPDYNEIGNAGSFFKNPIVSNQLKDSLLTLYPDLPNFRVDADYSKIPAAWLIQKAGWKGKSYGNCGVFEKHALILVNYGNAKGSEIKNLAAEIIASVESQFGINLEPEVIFIGE